MSCILNETKEKSHLDFCKRTVQMPASVMLWGFISVDGDRSISISITSLVSFKPAVKITLQKHGVDTKFKVIISIL